MNFNSPQELIDEFRTGGIVVLVDDEDRENEGDLVMAARHVTPEAVNFMARFGRGLICMPMTKARGDQLGLRLMVDENRESHRTQFTVSIDAAEGIASGISAADRATTIAKAAAPDARPSDFVQPGHVFPLLAETGGVLVRAGHTEAGCDLARLAGLEPAAVLVEILNEDGTMARRPELDAFAQSHDLKIGSIADLIEHRIRTEKTVERVGECAMPTEHGDYTMVAYRDTIERSVHLALVCGEINPEQPTLIRVHVQDSLADLTGSRRGDGGWPLADALRRIATDGGVVLILRNAESDDELLHRIHGYELVDQGVELPRPESHDDLRTYGLGAQILLDLGVRQMRVLSAPKRMHGISGFGLEVVEYVS
jgi:3,4-dihydroxy 2-butanone 4-phosphate synthase/GTP cyclohydrolase II